MSLVSCFQASSIYPPLVVICTPSPAWDRMLNHSFLYYNLWKAIRNLCSRLSPNLIRLWCYKEHKSDLLVLFPNIWAFPHFGNIVSLLYYDFVLNSADETQIYTGSCSVRSFIDQPSCLLSQSYRLSMYCLLFLTALQWISVPSESLTLKQAWQETLPIPKPLYRKVINTNHAVTIQWTECQLLVFGSVMKIWRFFWLELRRIFKDRLC